MAWLEQDILVPPPCFRYKTYSWSVISFVTYLFVYELSEAGRTYKTGHLDSENFRLIHSSIHHTNGLGLNMARTKGSQKTVLLSCVFKKFILFNFIQFCAYKFNLSVDLKKKSKNPITVVRLCEEIVFCSQTTDKNVADTVVKTRRQCQLLVSEAGP